MFQLITSLHRALGPFLAFFDPHPPNSIGNSIGLSNTPFLKVNEFFIR